MKIAIFTNNYLPNPYGVSGSVESFRQELERLGHIVYVFAPNFKGYVDENKNVFRYPAIDLKFKNVRFPVAIPYSYQISRLLEKLEIDVIHAQHPNLLGWSARHWARKKRVPLVFTWHTLYDQYAHYTPIVPSFLTAWWAIRNARSYANGADCVIVPTPSVKEIILKWGVTNKNIVVIPTGVDEKQLANPDKALIRKKYVIAEDEILLIVITRFTQEKNLEFLFEAVAEVLRENKKVKFLAGGDGNLTEKLKNFAAKQQLSAQIIFPGVVANEIKKEYYIAGDIFVSASKSETQGMAISEAMYLGLPIVAVAAPGVKDLVVSQVTGLLVREDREEFANAIKRLVADDILRKKFAENAGKIARQGYTCSVCTAKLIKVYEGLILAGKERKK